MKKENLTREYLMIKDELPNNPLGCFFSNVHNEEMEKNIGKKVVFVNPVCGYQKAPDIFIQGIQRDYKGDIIYRVCAKSVDIYELGYPCSSDKIAISNEM